VAAVYKSVACCGTSLCNKPDPKRDPGTRIVSTNTSSNSNKNKVNNSRNNINVRSMAVLARRAAANAKGKLACFANLARKAGQRPAVALKVYHVQQDGVEMCGRFQVKCTKNSKSCSRADVAAKAWK